MKISKLKLPNNRSDKAPIGLFSPLNQTSRAENVGQAGPIETPK